MRTTYCRICEAACGLIAETDDDGNIVKLRPDREHPVSRGYACAKGTRFHETAGHVDRLLSPQWQGRDTTWDHAIAEVAARIAAIVREHGPHSVGIYFGNPMAFNALGLLAVVGFFRAMGTRNVYFAGTQDCSNKFAAAQIVFGSPVIHPIPDFAHTDLAIVLGSNPYVSQSSFVHLEGGGPAVFGDLLARGGDVVWVDPRRTESAARWGQHLAIVPGTDAWLLLALLQLLPRTAPSSSVRAEGLDALLAAADRIDLEQAGERTGLGVPAIRDLARRIARSRSTALHMSVGVNQSGFGTLCYVLLQAIAFVTGNFDRRGGLVVNPTFRMFERMHAWSGVEKGERSRVGGFPALLGALPGGVLADEILRPGPDRIRAMIVIAGDPMRSIPGSERTREAFASLELLACIDMFKNRTGQLAHALLPSASWLERWDLATTTVPLQQAPLVQMSGPVVAMPGQVRTDARILSDLAIALRLPGPWRLGRLNWDRWLPSPKYGLPAPAVRPGRFLKRGRTFRLWHPTLDAEVDRLLAVPPRDGGFTLICRRRRLGHNSWLHGGARAGNPEATAWMRPDDMASLGLAPGSSAELRTEAGTLRIPIEAHEHLPSRTIVVPHGLADFDVNVLIPAGQLHIERLSGQLTMSGIPVDIARVEHAGEVLS